MKAKVLGLMFAVVALSLVAVGSAAALSSGNCGMDACYDNDALSQQPLELGTQCGTYHDCTKEEPGSMSTAPLLSASLCGGDACYDNDALSQQPLEVSTECGVWFPCTKQEP